MPKETIYDLVTGGSGFVGSHLVDYLTNQGRSVIVVDNFDAGREENLNCSKSMIELIRADTRDESLINIIKDFNIHRVFHLAANASVPRSSQDPMYDLTTNVVGTLNMLEIARQRRSQFIYISSAAVYGTPQYIPTDEVHPTEPISYYGTSKLSGEHYTDLYRREYGLDTRIIRYFNCFGPRQPRYIVFDYLRKAYESGDTFQVLGSGEQVRTQLYVTDAAEATVLVAEKGDSKPYNIGSEESFTVLDLAKQVLDITGQTHKKITITGHSWPGDIAVLKPDITRLKSLGFRQSHSLIDGLRKVLEWWNRNTELES